MAGICLAATALLFWPRIYTGPFAKWPTAVATTAIIFFQAQSIIWYPEVPYLYAFFFIYFANLVLRLSVLQSGLFTIFCIALIWPTLQEARLQPVMIQSAGLVTFALVLLSRANQSTEMQSFRDKLDKIEAQNAVINLSREFAQRLETKVSEQFAELQRMQRLKRLLPHSLAELVISDHAPDPLQTRRQEVSILFVDLRGFTGFAETAEPEDVMGVLREYHALVGGIAQKHGGIVEHFAGDGIMLIFNAPMAVPEHQRSAANAAVSIRSRLRPVIDRWRSLGFELGVSLGLASGYATVGEIGFEGRWDYGVVGPVTNLAFRLCGKALPNQILLSSRTAATLSDTFSLTALGACQLEGFRRPVDIVALPEALGEIERPPACQPDPISSFRECNREIQLGGRLGVE